MPTTTEYDSLQNERAKIIEDVIGKMTATQLADPNLADIVAKAVDAQLASKTKPPAPHPADGGFADLLGLGSTAPTSIGDTQIQPGVDPYDDQITSDRLMAAADLYYLWMHESLGIFQVIKKLQEEFRAGTLRISGGPGAFALYRFDKHSLLRYRYDERMRAYKRVLGYGPATAGDNARPNLEFHPLFTHFIGETAKFWRDKRISEVIRHNATDPAFGSIAIVRRAGLDLRTNLKNSSYGFVNVLRIETLQALGEAFKVLDAPDIKSQFGADTAWDVVELVMWQYFRRSVPASTMNRMGVAGRDILQWLAQPFILRTDRKVFEAELYPIAEAAEEWISSEQGLRLSRPTPPPKNVFQPGPPPRAGKPVRVVTTRGGPAVRASAVPRPIRRVRVNPQP